MTATRLIIRHTRALLPWMLVLAFFALPLLFPSPAAAVKCRVSGPAQLAGMLTPYLEQYSLPALSAAVVKRGDIVAVGAVGVRKAGTDADVAMDDRFHIGSDSKAITSLVAGMLVEEGKLRWDITVGEVFPELAGSMAPSVAKVTLEQLLSHTSGMPGDNQRFVDLIMKSLTREGNLDELRLWLVSQWAKEPLANPSGKVFAYSNMGYTLAGAMLERVTGRAWEELVAQRVFDRFGLQSAGFGPQASLGRLDATVGHYLIDGKLKPMLPGPNGDNPLVIGPAGTVHMSVLDFAKWAGWHAGQGKRGPRVVKTATIKKLHTPVIEFQRPDAAPGTPASGKYALGWGEMEVPWCPESVLIHNGSNNMNLARVVLLPGHDWAMVMMTNVGGKQAHEAFEKLCAELYRKYGPGKQ